MIIRSIVLFGLYLGFILLPLVVGALLDPFTEARPFLTELSVAFGYVGLSIMAFEFTLISRLHSVAGAFGQDALLQFHKEMGLFSFVLILFHPVLLVLSSFLPWSWMLLPWSEAPTAVRFGSWALLSLTLLILTSLFRRRLHMAYEWWDLVHRLTATAAVVMGLLHTYNVGSYAALPGMRMVWSGYLLLLVILGVRYRVVVPWNLRKRPWRVVTNKPERGHSTTLVLKPEGHTGFSFQPGQFAWLVTGRSAFSQQRHPISFSSCGDVDPQGEVAFTIKNLGDWSGRVVPSLKSGDVLWIDGPYGVFTTDRYEAPGYVLIGGGVGITPLRSMIETMKARQDVRPILLFYGTKNWEETTFRDDIHTLADQMPNLKVIYVLENPPSDWRGERGLMTSDILRRHLPTQYKRFRYFVCGPAPLMDLMEELLPDIGVPPDRIHTERFETV